VSGSLIFSHCSRAAGRICALSYHVHCERACSFVSCHCTCMYSGYSESLLYSSDPVAVTGYQTARITAAVYVAGFQMAAVGRAVLKLQQISMWRGWLSNCSSWQCICRLTNTSYEVFAVCAFEIGLLGTWGRGVLDFWLPLLALIYFYLYF
jgi:hypothetical protein